MKHLVCFQFEREYVNDQLFAYANQVFQELQEALPEEILEVKIHRNCVDRFFNGDLLVEMDVKNVESLRVYLVHPVHVALTDEWGPHISNRLSFDYE